MANEKTHNSTTGLDLYACRFQVDGDVFLSNPASDEVWGTGGHTAADYYVDLTEEDASGHYKGDFASGGTIAAGYYHVTIYLQAGANPANSDVAIAQGDIPWDGTSEITGYTLYTSSTSVLGTFRQVDVTENEAPGTNVSGIAGYL